MKFQVGDIITPLYNQPACAEIYKGDMGIVLRVGPRGGIDFDNYPQLGYIWSGHEDYFELFNPSLENE
jgi:hypothetical protein